MKPNDTVPVHFDATVDRVTGRISLGGEPKVIRPTETDFAIPTETPDHPTDPEVNDLRYGVRMSLLSLVEAEEGLESLRMAAFLKSLSSAERQSLYENIFERSASSFSWLLCVPPSHEEQTIADIKELLAMEDKHSSPFRTKRRALEQKLDSVIGDRYQHRNNARYVRANPHHIVRYEKPDGTPVVADEGYYRQKLKQTSI